MNPSDKILNYLRKEGEEFRAKEVQKALNLSVAEWGNGIKQLLCRGMIKRRIDGNYRYYWYDEGYYNKNTKDCL